MNLYLLIEVLGSYKYLKLSLWEICCLTSLQTIFLYTYTVVELYSSNFSMTEIGDFYSRPQCINSGSEFINASVFTVSYGTNNKYHQGP